MSLQARKGFSTVSTSVNNTTVLKEKILPITSCSAQQTGLVQVFLCVPTENRRFLRIWIDSCTLSFGLDLKVGFEEETNTEPSPNSNLFSTGFDAPSAYLCNYKNTAALNALPHPIFHYRIDLRVSV